MLTEPDVALTDYGLALECGTFAILLWRRRSDAPEIRPWFAGLFGSLGLAALFGGTVHGFFTDPGSIGQRLLWPATLIAIGAAALAAWVLGARILLPPPYARRIALTAGVAFGGYVIIVLSIAESFLIAIVNYAAAALFLLLAFLISHARASDRVRLAGIAGLVLVFVGSAIQQAGLGVHPVYFNHNALYHLVEGVALFLVFASARRLVAPVANPRSSVC